MCEVVFVISFVARPIGRGHFVFWVWLGVLKGFPFVCNVVFEAWFVMRSVG